MIVTRHAVSAVCRMWTVSLAVRPEASRVIIVLHARLNSRYRSNTSVGSQWQMTLIRWYVPTVRATVCTHRHRHYTPPSLHRNHPDKCFLT